MNLATTLSACAGTVAVLVALFTFRVGGAPDSREQRWFSVVALAAGVYALGNVPLTVHVSDVLVAWVSRLQFASALLHIWGWVRFSQAFLRQSPGRLELMGARGILASAGLVLVPGLGQGGPILEHPFPALGVVYQVLPTTGVGDAILLVGLGAATLVLVRFARAAIAGVRHARLLSIAVGVLLAFGASEALVAAGKPYAPSLLDLAFTFPILAVGWMLTARFVESSTALQTLRGDLEAKIVASNRELASALDALHHSEKLAALGQFASGVAHEVNSPAAVVTTNLRYLDGFVTTGSLPPDAREVLGDAIASMRRINELVRRLVNAGRIAVVPGARGTVAVAETARKVLAEARTRCPPSVEIVAEVPEDLFVLSRGDALEQILACLVANGVEAVPPGRAGRVHVEAERSGGVVRVTVSDDGIGMGPEVLRRAFDPFFTTKPFARGTGLGLPVARGLAEASGGTLRLRSEPGKGSTAALELPNASRPALPVAPS